MEPSSISYSNPTNYGKFIYSGSTLGSISIPVKLGMSFTYVGSFPVNYWSKQSLKLCAGSVDIIKVFE